MKKYIVLSILLLCFTKCFANESFEVLCFDVFQKNIDMQEAKKNTKLSKSKRIANLALLLPAISVEGSLSYNYEIFQKEYPETAQVSLNLSQYFIGGSTLNLSGTYTYYTTESNTINYENAASASLYLTQSLNPWWFSLNFVNPDFYIPKLYYLISKQKEFCMEYQVMTDFLRSFIEYKALLSQIELQQKNYNYYKEMYEASLSLFNNGNTAYINLFDTYQKYYEVGLNFEALKERKKNMINDFCRLTSYAYSQADMEKVLEKALNENWKDIFIKNYSYLTLSKFLENSENIVQNSIKYDKNVYLLQRQEAAPKMSVGINCNYDVISKHNFSVSVGFDFSSLFSPSYLTLKKDYKLNKKINENQFSNTKNTNQNTKESYEKTFYELQKQYLDCVQEYNNFEKIYFDYEKLYEKQMCSKLDFMNIELLYFQLKVKLETIYDEFFYYAVVLSKTNEYYSRAGVNISLKN